ncbi:hypothetical protein [Methanobrevibacter filiformis]|uniref:Uncharacterized protein n=1 Tax=Methanobrevibacter filiformis TaxID=55758 RepID=A0A166C0Y6_9EURY|nr:hypothetical protein [Methanobrevibacter filiformis]KZX14018.1 hypothetical protein MBFIL_09450 [Methanobrevibacter filiformis]
MDYLECNANDLENFAETNETVLSKLSVDKKRKFADNLDDFFNPIGDLP